MTKVMIYVKMSDEDSKYNNKKKQRGGEDKKEAEEGSGATRRGEFECSFSHLRFRCFSQGRILDGIDIHSAFICESMKHIVGRDGSRSCLLVTENQINPIIEMFTHIVRFCATQAHRKEAEGNEK